MGGGGAEAGQEPKGRGAAIGAAVVADLWQQRRARVLAKGVAGHEGQVGGSPQGVGVLDRCTGYTVARGAADVALRTGHAARCVARLGRGGGLRHARRDSKDLYHVGHRRSARCLDHAGLARELRQGVDDGRSGRHGESQ